MKSNQRYKPLLSSAPDEDLDVEKDSIISPEDDDTPHPGLIRMERVYQTIIALQTLLIIALAWALIARVGVMQNWNPVFPQVLYCTSCILHGLSVGA